MQDGLFENSTEVVITVTDVNDNAPEFSENVYLVDNVVEETMPPSPGGQFLVQVFLYTTSLYTYSCTLLLYSLVK